MPTNTRIRSEMPAEAEVPLNADDLADAEFLQTRTTDNGQKVLAVLLVLYADVLRVGVLVAASGAIANALAAGVGGCSLRTLLRFYPRESSALLKASVRVRMLFPLSQLRWTMEAFHEHLGRAKQTSLDLAARSGQSADQAGQMRLAESWRSAAGRTQTFLSQLQYLLHLSGVPAAMADHGEMVRLLGEVVGGRCPMLDGGEVILPKSLERRQSERARLWAPAVLTAASATHRVIIRDISATGLGLDCAHDVPVGAAVVVSAGAALRLEGVIAWSQAGRAGVRLSSPLMGPDPLFAFCAKVTQLAVVRSMTAAATDTQLCERS